MPPPGCAGGGLGLGDVLAGEEEMAHGVRHHLCPPHAALRPKRRDGGRGGGEGRRRGRGEEERGTTEAEEGRGQASFEDPGGSALKRGTLFHPTWTGGDPHPVDNLRGGVCSEEQWGGGSAGFPSLTGTPVDKKNSKEKQQETRRE